MSLATINAIWIGSKLGLIHAACLRSFVRHGHQTILHVYERPFDVPDGIELSDANELLPASQIIHYSRGGSPAISANLIRYEVLRRALGLYVDCDVFCLRPIQDADHIFGFETANSINNGVLKLPQDCQVLDELRRLKSGALIPPWVRPAHQLYYRWRAGLGVPVKIQDMPWGTTGPRALTWYLKQYGLDRHAEPIDVFYPLHYDQVPLLLDPDLRIEDVISSRTRLLHLYNEKLRHMNLSQVPETSPLGMVLAS
jgi:hypothetical protein